MYVNCLPVSPHGASNQCAWFTERSSIKGYIITMAMMQDLAACPSGKLGSTSIPAAPRIPPGFVPKHASIIYSLMVLEAHFQSNPIHAIACCRIHYRRHHCCKCSKVNLREPSTSTSWRMAANPPIHAPQRDPNQEINHVAPLANQARAWSSGELPFVKSRHAHKYHTRATERPPASSAAIIEPREAHTPRVQRPLPNRPHGHEVLDRSGAHGMARKSKRDDSKLMGGQTPW